MAKLSERYEAVVVFSVKEEDNVPALVTKFSDLIKGNAELESVDEWGRRKLAYPINYENDGYYVLYTFTAKPDVPAEFERVINITDGVLRSLVVLKQGDAAVPAPAPEPVKQAEEAPDEPEAEEAAVEEAEAPAADESAEAEATEEV
jgi:small subunit ribosomal protein S6